MAKPNQPTAAYPTCKFTDIASFRPGIWNGKPHPAAFVKQLVDNFKKYSTGPTPFYQPYVSLNHKDEFAAGYVSGAKLNPGDVLSLDAEEVPEVIGQMRRAGAIRQPSIEYYEPKRDGAGNLVDGFRGPDGQIVDGPVLKCLTLLGADAPAVKGLPPLPFAKFAQSGSVSTFGSVPAMDRAAMLAALQALGADVSSITDAVPDEVLKMVLDLAQKLQATPPAETPPEVPAMADAGAGIGTAGAIAPAPAPAPTIPGVGTAQPSSVVLKFNDTTPAGIAAGLQQFTSQVNGVLASLTAQASGAAAQLAAVNRAATQQAYSAKFSDVTAFVNSLATPDANGMVRIQPAQKPVMVAMMMKLDGGTVRKFADGKTTGTELEEYKRLQLATLPKLRATGERVPDPLATGAAGTHGAGGPTIDPARRFRMLSATPQGKKVLALEAANAKK